MWKKLDELASVPPKPSSSSQEEDTVTQMLMSAIRDSSHEKVQQVDDAALKVTSKDQAFQEYAEAADKFSKSAQEFIRCAPLFSAARQAYEELKRASEQVRRFLDSDEQQFRALMNLAQDQANSHLTPTEAPSGRKQPESSKPEPFIVNSDNRKMNNFP